LGPRPDERPRFSEPELSIRRNSCSSAYKHSSHVALFSADPSTGRPSDPTSLKLVRTWVVVNAIEGAAEVVGQGVGGGDGVVAGLDLDGLVAAGSADELLY